MAEFTGSTLAMGTTAGEDKTPWFAEKCSVQSRALPGKPCLRCLPLHAPSFLTNSLLPELQLAGTCCSPGKPARALLFPELFFYF